jgi:hypothetical protein
MTFRSLADHLQRPGEEDVGVLAMRPPPDSRKADGQCRVTFDAAAPDPLIAASSISIVREMWRAERSEMPAADDQRDTASSDFSLRNKFGRSCWSSRPLEGKP